MLGRFGPDVVHALREQSTPLTPHNTVAMRDIDRRRAGSRVVAKPLMLIITPRVVKKCVFEDSELTAALTIPRRTPQNVDARVTAPAFAGSRPRAEHDC